MSELFPGTLVDIPAGIRSAIATPLKKNISIKPMTSTKRKGLLNLETNASRSAEVVQ